MVPSEYANFFVASTGAGAALIGLLFVVISIAPERTVMGSALPERRAVASNSFTALLNAFFISFGALLPHANMAWVTIVMSSISITGSFALAFKEFRRPSGWQMVIRRIVLVVTSIVLYALELGNAIQLAFAPNNVSYVFSLTTLVIGVYGLGIVRSWELLGADRFSLLGWFNPLYDVNRQNTQANTDTPDSNLPIEVK